MWQSRMLEVSFRVKTHQAGVKELAAMKCNSYIALHCQKVALGHTTEATAGDQLAHTQTGPKEMNIKNMKD